MVRLGTGAGGRDERGVLEILHDVGQALVAELDLQKLVQAVTDAATELSGAEFGSFFYNVIDERGEAYQLFSLSGAPVEAFADFPMPRNTAIFEPTFRGADVVRLDDVTADARFGQNPPYHGMPEGHLPVRSYMGVAVVSRSGEVLGGLFFGHSHVGVFTEREEHLVVGIARQAAIAIDNARLYQAAQQQIAARERLAERLASLQELTARLAGARAVDEVADVALSQGRAALAAAAGAVCLCDDDGQSLRLVRQAGLGQRNSEDWQVVSIEAPVPVADAVRTGEVVLIESVEERDRRYPALAATATSNQSFAAVPLALGDRIIGALALSFLEPRMFTDEDRDFLRSVASQCAVAVERARLHEAEQRASHRQHFLAEASRLLYSSLDPEATLQRAARLVVPTIADSCSIHLSDDEGLALVALAHRDPALEAVMRVLSDAEGGHTTNPMMLEAAATGRAVLYPEVPAEVWASLARDDAELHQLRQLDVRSGILVPLRARGRVIGVLSATTGQGRRLDSDALDLLRDFADRAAVAIDNARSHELHRATARTLQHSLLPPRLPEIPGLEVAARYHPVSDGSEVGGDFYDVFPAGPDRWGIVVGDVCGKGVTAAALTSLARYTVRAASLRERSPADVLAVVNQAVLDAETEDRFCTVALAFVEVTAGEARVQLAVGGHPLPLVLRADGGLQAVGSVGTAMGLFHEALVDDATVVLGPGDALVMVTDGFLDARSPAGDFDPALVERSLAASAGQPAEVLAATLAERALAYQEGRPHDDMAVLAIRKIP